MPRYRNVVRTNWQEFVDLLVNELRENVQPIPGNPSALANDKPVIIESPTGFGDRYRVTVIWDRWSEVALEDRNKIIMEAYRQVVGAESTQVSLTLGVTRAQYEKMHTISGQAFGI